MREHVVRHAGLDEAWTDGVDADVGVPQLVGGSLGHAVHTEYGDEIQHLSGNCEAATHADLLALSVKESAG